MIRFWAKYTHNFLNASSSYLFKSFTFKSCSISHLKFCHAGPSGCECSCQVGMGWAVRIWVPRHRSFLDWEHIEVFGMSNHVWARQGARSVPGTFIYHMIIRGYFKNNLSVLMVKSETRQSAYLQRKLIERADKNFVILIVWGEFSSYCVALSFLWIVSPWWNDWKLKTIKKFNRLFWVKSRKIGSFRKITNNKLEIH